jgi:hypothetical protein
VVEDSVLLRYDAVSLGSRFQTVLRKPIALKDILFFFETSEIENPVTHRNVSVDRHIKNKILTLFSFPSTHIQEIRL